MRVLMLAPHVFFAPRGTPLSVFYRAKALGELGHRVDVLTYHLGQDVDAQNVRILRAPAVPFIRSLEAGPSMPKMVLDVSLLLRLVWQLLTRRYDVIYTHEEAALFGAWNRVLSGIPHVYDMHSSMPLQLKDWEFSSARWLRRLFDRMERFVIRQSDVIVPICGNLADIARRIRPNATIVTIENTAVLADEPKPSTTTIKRLRNGLGLKDRRVVLYTGTFLKIQGLDLLLDAAPAVIKKVPDVLFLLVGGSQKEIADTQNHVDRLGIGRNVRLVPNRPQEEMPSFYAVADVLVSPRQIGINAPLKIFSYLNSGKPLVCTDLPIHRQIVQESAAMLVPPSKKAWSDALVNLLSSAALRKKLGAAGKALVASQYGYGRYKERLRLALMLATRSAATKR